MQQIIKQLKELADPEYAQFHRRLIPNVPPETVLGVRIPALRRLAKELAERDCAKDFLSELPHSYYDENCLHGLLINEIRDFDRTVSELDAFLPHVDNWAVCDLINPKAFRKRPPELIGHIRRWMADGHPFTVRFAIGMLLKLYLDQAFQPEYLDWAAGIDREEYYIKMMVAWYFAEALVKQYADAVPYLEAHRLPEWIHRKAIQKAVESYRITPEQKAYLRSLKEAAPC